MTIKTIPVRVNATTPGNTPAVAASVTAQLVDGRGVAAAFGVDGGVVVPWLVTGTTDNAGSVLLQLWPNERGTDPTLYRVIVKSGEIVLMNATIAVPDSDPAVELALGALINRPPWPAVSASQQALTQLQAAQAVLTGNVVDSEQAVADVAELQGQINATKAQIDTINGQIDTKKGQVDDQVLVAAQQASAASGFAAQALGIFGSAAAMSAALAIMLGYANTAQGAQSLAQAYAAQAGSVPQQDLSGVISKQIYFSPNGIVTAFAENLKNDRDGGAWREKVAWTSWMQEPLTGPQIGAFASELLARGDNLVQFPEELDNNYWVKSACTITPNASIAPDGTMTMDKIVPSASGTGSAVSKTNLMSATSTTKAVAVSAKAGEKTWVYVGPATSQGVWFDLANGVKGTESGGATGAIVPEANGCYRLTVTAPNSINRTPFIKPVNGDGSLTVTANGTDGIYAWGIKVIEGGPMTAYVPMATMTGKVFQLTTDGKYYSLGAGYGALTEALRGNTQKFPREPQFVVEAGRLVILDGAAPGRPMWKVYPFVAGVNSTGTGLVGAAYKDGVLALAATAGGIGLRLLDFAKDKATGYGTAGASYARVWDGIADYTKHTAMAGVPNPTLIPSNTVNAGAMFSMPDAPCDPTTRLPVPTIVLGTATGGSIIQHNGVAVNSSDTGSMLSVAIDQYAVYFTRSGSTGGYIALKPSTLGASFALTQIGTSTGAPDWASVAAGANTRSVMGKRGRMWRNVGNVLSGIVFNEADPASSLSYKVSDSYSTGLMLKPIRAWACSTSPGVVDGAASVVTGDSSTFTGGIGAWFPNAGAALAAVGGELEITLPGANNAGASITMNGLDIGGTYKVTGGARKSVGTVSGYTFGVANIGSVAGNATASTPITYTFTAAAASHTLFLNSSGANTAGEKLYLDDVLVVQQISDRGAKNKPLTVVGALTKTPVAAAAQAVFFGNFSASNYGVEAYSADWDFGTGAWSIRQPMILPVTLPASMFPVLSSVSLAGGGWVNGVSTSGFDTFATSGGTQVTATRTTSGGTEYAFVGTAFTATAGEFYRYNAALSANTYTLSNPSFGLANSAVPRSTLSTPVGTGAVSGIMSVTSTGSWQLRLSATSLGSVTVDSVTLDKVGTSIFLDRSAATGASIKWGVNPDGTLTATVTDSVGATRTVTTTAAYNTGMPIVTTLAYTPDGTLSISVNGQVAAQATGTPLGSMSNASATVTWGNSRDLTAPFPGQLAMTIAQAAAPTTEQSVFAYEQQKAMFQPGAQITLPDSGAVVDLDYDSALDRVKCTSAAYECSFNGLVRVESNAVSAGSFTKGSLRNGVKLMARSTTNPGVDISYASLNLREELDRRAEDAARRDRATVPVTFTATSAQTAFPLRPGDELAWLAKGSAFMVPGTANDYTVGFDGFKETITTNAGVALNTVVTAMVRRAA